MSNANRIRVVFEGGDFQACRAAEDWCRKRGISVGPMQRGEPRGLLYGDYLIAKWRNLNGLERRELHGTMTAPTGSMRAGPVAIEICEQPS